MKTCKLGENVNWCFINMEFHCILKYNINSQQPGKKEMSDSFYSEPSS